jgi:hypothetical protein
MTEEEIIKLAEEISFRLLATKNHESFEWLTHTLKKTFQDKDK